VDTGSTGFLINAGALDAGALKVGGTPGYEFLSSSKKLYVGTWVPATITFFDATGKIPQATPSVPVLAVKYSGICPSYDEKKDGSDCPGSPLERADQIPFFYMGVGFAREGDGMPQGTPDKNPFLNLTTIGGQRVAPARYNPGYILDANGVIVGLTAKNTQGFSLIGLGQADPKFRGDWPPPRMCLQVGASPCYQGILLVDTGIPQSYITVPNPIAPSELVEAIDPSTHEPLKVLKEGVTVTLGLPLAAEVAATYSYTVAPGPSPLVIPQCPKDGTPFVNTGRSFLRTYRFLYDFENGYIGLKKHD
jgi:hypothetical protein